MKKFFLFIPIILSVFTMSVLAAQKNDQSDIILFNKKLVQKKLEKITKKLTESSIKLSELILYSKELDELQDQLQDCVSTSDKQYKVINRLLKSMKLDQLEQIEEIDYQYLKDKKLLYARQLSDCRLLSYRAEEISVKYKDAIQELSTYKILKRGTPVWRIYNKEILMSLKDFDGEKLYQASVIEKFTISKLIIGLLLIAFGIGIAIYIRLLCFRWLRRHKEVHIAAASFVQTLSSFIIPLTFFCVISAFLNSLHTNETIEPIIKTINDEILFFITMLALSKYFLYPSPRSANPLGFSKDLGRLFYKRITFLLSWGLLGYIIAIIFSMQSLPLELSEVSRTLYITLLSFLIVWFCWLFSKVPQVQKRSPIVVLLIKVFLSVLLLTMIATEWLGFHQLAVYLIKGILLTFLLLGITIILWRLTTILSKFLDDDKYILSKKIRKLFGVKRGKQISEILIIKFVFYLYILFVFFIGVMKAWQISENIIDMFIDGFFEGFSLANVRIVPSRVFIALLLFAVFLLFGRLIATSVARQKQHKGEEEKQIAIASIIIYIIFAVALLFMLLVMGVNFTGLAIIAGALSVGIGLGLQGIVNNFFSGLILLIEKPIKPGDRIVVGDMEGFVKKIRIRSTQVTTLAREDVIVPNADLISNQVINYMFRDRNYRIVCQVGVAYGSKVELVKEVLLDVASKHPDVMQETPNDPIVLFRDFGENSLIFELWCIIHDVNKKFYVASDLNFSIDKAFRENKITIAFPQRDIHIKET